MGSEIDHQPSGRPGLVSLGQVKHDISVSFEPTPRLALLARDKELERTESRYLLEGVTRPHGVRN